MSIDVPGVAQHLRYFAGWCDKIQGSTIPVATEGFTAYTLREPMGVVGQMSICRLLQAACKLRLCVAFCMYLQVGSSVLNILSI